MWAPHSNVADFLKGIDDDVGNNTANSTESHYSESVSTGESGSGTSHKSNTNLPGEKVGQQTRSIRSIRLIANNNSSNSINGGGGSGFLHNKHISSAKNFISSSFRHHHKQESQRARGEHALSRDEILGKSSIVDDTTPRDWEDDEEDADDDDNVAVFHVNNNKFPVISSIRHYRSRKSFSRTRKSTNPGGADIYSRGNGGSGRTTGRDNMMTTTSIRDHFNYESATMANVPSSRYEKTEVRKNPPRKPIKSLSFSEQTKAAADSENVLDFDDEETNNDNGNKRDETVKEGEDQTKSIYEMPQGDAPHTEQGKHGTAHSRYYYGQVATRVHSGLDDEGKLEVSSIVGGTSRGSLSSGAGERGNEHYGKIIDKPALLRGDGHIISASNEGQKSGYSSSDDTATAALYENSYFIPKDVSSSSVEAADGEDGSSSRTGMKRPSQLSTSETNGFGLRNGLGAQERNSSILHRINKTFLSRSAKLRQQQQHQKQQQHLESRGLEGNTEHVSESLQNSDLLVNKALDLNHRPISPPLRDGSSDSNTFRGPEKGWQKENGGHNGKGASMGHPSGGSKEINNYSSQSTYTTIGTSINTSNSQWSTLVGGSSAFSRANSNIVRDEDKLKATLNDSDYAIAESGKAHSLQEALVPSSYAFSGERAPGVSPTKKQQRNRSGQPRQERRKQKQQQQSEGSKRPVSGLPVEPNDPHNENGSGSLSETSNFHTSQGNLRVLLFFHFACSIIRQNRTSAQSLKQEKQ